MRRAMRLAATEVVVLTVLAQVAGAQPIAWSAWRDRVVYLGPLVTRLSTFDLGTKRDVSVPLPDGIDIGKGVLTPDGRYYLLPTSVGIARFRTTPPAFDRLLGAGVPVDAVTVEPSGSRLHATGTFGHAVLDWATGDLFSVKCCSQPRVSFSRDGAFSVFVEVLESTSQSRISVFAEPAHTMLWSRTIAGRSIEEVAGDAYVAARGDTQIIVWSLLDGVERARLDGYDTTGVAWQGHTLLTWRNPGRLSAYDVTTAQERVVVDAYWQGRTQGLSLASDGRYAYVTHWVTDQGSRGSTWYQVIDLTTNTRVREKEGWLEGRRDLALENAPLCSFSVGVAPESMSGEGGIFGVPVTPGSACRAWTEPDALNSGPHAGATTIFFGVAANQSRGPVEHRYRVADRMMRVVQASATPGAPELIVGIMGNRATLRWSPTVGGGVTSWYVRGGLAGTPLTDLATMKAHERSWTSPPLPAGSYEAEVVPTQSAGGVPTVPPYEAAGPASNRVRFSIGLTDVPLAPTSVSAVVVDDVVSLQWLTPREGPAPSSYVIEAAPAGWTTWIPVATTPMPFLIVTRAPPGTWHVRVRAQTDGGFSVPSSPLELTTVACRVAPGAPQDLWAVVTGSTATIRWSRPATGAAHEYILEGSLRYGEGDIGRVTFGGSVHELTVPVSPAGTHYFVQVRARNDCGESPPSNPVALPFPG